MESPFKKFEIIGLFGYKDVQISFNNNLLIVIGENGFGKTSILNALTFTIQGKWKSLLKINFKSISIQILDSVFSFTFSQLKDYCEYLDLSQDEDYTDISDLIKERIGDESFQKLCHIIEQGDKRELITMISSNQFLSSIPNSILYNTLYNKLERDKQFSVFNSLPKSVQDLGCEILYLPTYRRVEITYESLPFFKDSRRHRQNLPVGNGEEENDMIMRFGMSDVKKRIANITNNISQSFLEGYAEVSGDMIKRILYTPNQNQRQFECDHHQMKIILDRIGNKLTGNEKSRILKMVDDRSQELYDNTNLVYFLQQLLNVYKKQERYDQAIKSFCNVCNEYLREKEFVYDESNPSITIYRKFGKKSSRIPEDIVLLNQLSSGEKQIVSIFSQIYLDVDKQFIILLDEPELSLSIFWQEKFIPHLLASNKCKFIMCVTHSPFIFGEKLKKYTVGISQFLNQTDNG